MQKWKIAGIILMLCVVNRVSAQQDNYDRRVRDYIEQFKTLAIREQKRSGIPAAITLAQGIHETSAGNSELATEANNHFGIKCKKEWKGMTFAHTDDAVDECFRKYDKAEDSYHDHSEYLKNSARYAALFALSQTDYAGWAIGLKRCGYATNPKYSQVLIRLIEDYHLQDYTYAALSDDYNPVKDAQKASDRSLPAGFKSEIVPEKDAAPADFQTRKRTNLSVSYNAPAQAVTNIDQEPVDDAPAVPVFNRIVRVNGLKAFYAAKGTVLLNDAFKNNVRYAKLLELNDLPDAPLEADMYVYLEKKHAKGLKNLHVVKAGETLSQIAQSESIQLRYLKYYNRIAANEEPVPGAVLQLQEYSDKKPETVAREDRKRIETLSFAGDNLTPVPQGATRVRAGFRRKNTLVADAASKVQPVTADIQEDETVKEPAAKQADDNDYVSKTDIPAAEPAIIPSPGRSIPPRHRVKKEELPDEAEADLVKQGSKPAETTAKPAEFVKPPVEEIKVAKAAPAPQENPAPVQTPAEEPEMIRKDAKPDEGAVPASQEAKIVAEDPKPAPAVVPASQEPKVVAEASKPVQAVAPAARQPKIAAKESQPVPPVAPAPQESKIVAEEPKQPEVIQEPIPEVKKEDIIANTYPEEDVKAAAEARAAEEKKEVAAAAEEKKDIKADTKKDDLALIVAAKSVVPADGNDEKPATADAEKTVEPVDEKPVVNTVEQARQEAAPVTKTDAGVISKEAIMAADQEAAASKPDLVEEKPAVISEDPAPAVAAPAVAEKPASADEPKQVTAEPVKEVSAQTEQPVTEPVAATPAEPASTTPPTPPGEVEKPKEPAQPEEPMDEFARLKARLDKVVYADNKPAASPAPEPAIKKEEPKKEEPSKKDEAPKASAKGSKYYTVRKGDTAFIIARRNNITMKQLMSWNKLDFETIKEGQQLKVKP